MKFSPNFTECHSHGRLYAAEQALFFRVFYSSEGKRKAGVERETRAMGGRRGKLIKIEVIQKVAYLLTSYQWLPFRVL